MSRQRDLKAAQAALNEIVGEFVETLRVSGVTRDTSPKFTEMIERWDALERIRNDFDGDAPASARDTSINAAKANLPLKGSMRRTILQTLVAHAADMRTGMTCDELEARLRKSHQTMSPAVNYLETAGWIEDSTERRQTRAGQPAIVWVPTAKAVKRLREIGLGGE